MQMETKKQSLTGREVRLRMGEADRAGQQQGQFQDKPESHKSKAPFDWRGYVRRIERVVIPDAVALLHGWPLRQSWFVDQAGRLRKQPEEAGR